MSDSINSNDSGFRSRQNDRLKRQQSRKRLINNFKKFFNQQIIQNYVTQDKDQQKPRAYMRLQQLAQLHKAQQPVDQQSQQLDMFADPQSNKKSQHATKQKMQQNDLTDQQGYYSSIQNSLIGNKYKIIQKLGKGMFGQVVKVENQGKSFAIKIIRKNQMMLRSGEKEYQILAKLKNHQYIMKLYDYFFEQGHLCLVCQLMADDLRSYVRKHQSTVTLDSIKKYAICMFMSLHQLRKNKIIHADIKPDNFLFTIDHSKIKLCDFGTSYRIEEHSSQIEYLVARYYRAPQIILGYETSIQNRHHLDTWAVACSLYQLYTGQFLFNGSNNNQMLKQMMQTKGKFNNKMLKNSLFLDKHFDNQHNFLYNTLDKITKKSIIKKMQISITTQRQLLHLLRKNCQSGQQQKKIHNFKDFLQKCLSLNPKDRLTPQQAFLHPFLNYQVKLI